MNKKYSKEERRNIALEAIDSKDKNSIALKYDLHFTTIYTWIREFTNAESRDSKVTFKLTKSEKDVLLKRCKALGYEDDLSSYLRKVLFSKHIAAGNPKEIIKELYNTRGELNKAGSNLNQIANYTNFLKSQNYIEDGYAKDLLKYLEVYGLAMANLTEALDKTIKKI